MRTKRAKIIKILICVVALSIGLNACNYANVETTYDPEQEDIQSMFVEVESTSAWKVVYHRKTKVMYAVSWSSYNYGTFTLLVDENGEPMLYEE